MSAVEILQVSEKEFISIAESVITIVSDSAQGIQGIQGLKGDTGNVFTKEAAVNISGHRVILADTLGKADYASNEILSHANKVIGLSTGAVSQSAQATIQSYGELVEPSWNWTQDVPVYLGADGYLTQTPPASPAAKFSLVVGFPTSATSLFIKIGIPIILI